ncbi:MAG: hypothetical protein AAF367_19210 [Pseudomonadota bacterium]
MRGEQIAACRASWASTLDLTPTDLNGVDAVVVVKRTTPETLSMIKSYGIPLIYDPLDFWRQPKSRLRPRSRAQRMRSVAEVGPLFRAHFARYDPDLVICVTRKMAAGIASLGCRTEVIYHHADPRLPDMTEYQRQRADTGRDKTLLYFGNQAFLREWSGRIDAAARSLGARFVTLDSGKGSYHDPPVADAMIAVRGGRDGCWISRAWKSNVKAATAAALGLPLVAWREAAYEETAPEAHWFDDETSLKAAIAAALSPDARTVAQRFPVEAAADRFEAVIADLLDNRPVPPGDLASARNLV